ncbi:hypothetical protein VNO78_12378 [Psophocarpus tetragonolobus]|uniref:C2H2-type domain-containing protein n=1 Tax=Psophocarpus tetragonolobus TaxID=3891 RepID=A0AAN9XP76_PSOTE
MDVDKPISVKNSFPTVRECDICGRTFDSGKAFGGHRKWHFHKSKKVKVSNRDNCNDDSDHKFICCICKKQFSSKNSLFGHMRAHPKRPWKGVSFPTHFSSLNSDDDDNDNDDSDDDDYDNDYYDNNHDNSDCDTSDNREIAQGENHTHAIGLEKFTTPSWLKKDVRGRECVGAYGAAETLVYLSANCTLAK